MYASDIIQFSTMILCALTSMVWMVLGHYRSRYRYVRWIFVIPSSLVTIFYISVLLTHWNVEFPDAAIMASALIRFFTWSLFLVGGIAIGRNSHE
jgi:hypothetical protein